MSVRCRSLARREEARVTGRGEVGRDRLLARVRWGGMGVTGKVGERTGVETLCTCEHNLNNFT